MSQPKAKNGAGRASRPTWRVTSARFELSSPDLKHCPEPDRPEIAVAGRSNVGKSSLLNAFSGQNGLARVSRTPGRTRLLNFFALQLRSPKDERFDFRVVDLPGYGFAKAHKSVRDTFGPMIGAYLRDRNALRALLVLVDARRGPSELDVELLSFGAEVRLPCLVVATKGDKLSKSERGLIPGRFSKQLGGGVSPRDIIVTSSSSGLGLDPRIDSKGGSLPREVGRIIRTEERSNLVAEADADADAEHA